MSESSSTAVMDALRQQVSDYMVEAMTAFDMLGWSEIDSLREIAHQALFRAFVLYNVLAPEQQQELIDTPVLYVPEDRSTSVQNGSVGL